VQKGIELELSLRWAYEPARGARAAIEAFYARPVTVAQPQRGSEARARAVSRWFREFSPSGTVLAKGSGCCARTFLVLQRSEDRMPNSIQIRDVVRNTTFERGPDEPVLLVPYDLFKPAGAVHKHGELVDWQQGDATKSGRAVPELLKNTSPGERVLMRLDANAPVEEWWLCEIVSVDGVAGTKES